MLYGSYIIIVCSGELVIHIREKKYEYYCDVLNVSTQWYKNKI
jgi:hypothetical protein